MKGREDRTQSVAAFTITHGEKAQPSPKKGACKHCGRFGHNESSSFKLLSTHLVGDPVEKDEVGKGLSVVDVLAEAAAEEEAERRHIQQALFLATWFWA